MTSVLFVVEQAGCNSCATRVRDAIAGFGTVHDVAIDEVADVARVSLSVGATALSEDAVNQALREASVGAGHEYRVQPGSWRAQV